MNTDTLIELCRSGQKDEVDAALDKGADPNSSNDYGTTLIEAAAEAGQDAVVRTLLDHEARPDMSRTCNYTPLHRAAAGGHDAVVRTLLDHGVDLNITGTCKYTPLHVAAERGQDTVVRTLLEKRADPNLKERTGLTAFECAAKNGYKYICKTLLDKASLSNVKEMLKVYYSGREDEVDAALGIPAGLNSRNCDDAIAIPPEKAAEGGYDIIKLSRFGQHLRLKDALDEGYDANSQNRYGTTPLEAAAEGGFVAAVQTLLEYGADQNKRGNSGYTPLHRAVQNGHDAVVRTLLEHGAGPNLDNGRKALQIAVDKNNYDIYKTLLPKVHQPDWDRLLPSFSGVGWKDEVEEALSNGADPNIPVEECNLTALYEAAKAGNDAVVQTLLANGADSTPKKFNEFTALLLAPFKTREIIENFRSLPFQGSLQSRCRTSIRGRLVENLHANGKQPVKSAVDALSLPSLLKSYLSNPLTL